MMKNPLFTFLLFLLCASSLKAQLKEFEISEMPRPDVSSVQANAAFPEDALIFVYSSFDNLSFRSSVGAVDKQYYNSRANRYEILVKPLKQMIFISASEFMEQKLATINPKPKEDYYFKVEEKLSVMFTGKGTLVINSIPEGAEIYINSLKLSDKTPATFEYPQGAATIKLVKVGFMDTDTLIRINENNKTILDFILKSSLPIVNTLSIDSISYNSASVSGQLIFNGGSPILEQGICWSKNQNPTLSDYVKKMSLSTSKFSGVISELRSNTTYYFRAFATNKNGISYGSEVTFKTQVSKESSGLVSDFDGNIYPTITVGTQVWMAENLKSTHYANGDLISNISGSYDWINLNSGAWCNYSNSKSNDTIYGKLYNWYAVSDKRNVCPIGWHIPSDEEWTIQTNFLGGDALAGGKLKTLGDLYWIKPNVDANNKSGFSGLPGGYRNYNGKFFTIGYFGYYWSSTEHNSNKARCRFLYYDNGISNRDSYEKRTGFSVRCLKD